MNQVDLIVYRRQSAAKDELTRHLSVCDTNFTPPLSQRVDVATYAGKLATHAVLFEAWCAGTLVGLVAAYKSESSNSYFISNVSVYPEFGGRSIASNLVRQCIDEASRAGAEDVRLEVSAMNGVAIHIYRKLGFVTEADSDRDSNLTMTLRLTK